MYQQNQCNVNNGPKLCSINDLLDLDLTIPEYQRPYKWTARNITDLLIDIQNSIEESKNYNGFKYRIGTIILYDNKGCLEIVDGQQRTLSFLLLKLCLDKNFSCPLLKNTKFPNKITQQNLHDNFTTIREWLSSTNLKESFTDALSNILEVVVITIDKVEEAFQLFDSQNTRGRALDPHDLLKAYHLREIHDKYEMQRVVTKWEAKNPKDIKRLFSQYLFPIWNWSKRRKSEMFTSQKIDPYKGIGIETGYTYAYRAHKAMPHFQISESFIAGSDFFEMVDHYMFLLSNIKDEIKSNPNFETIQKEINKNDSRLNYALNLFFCALLCYYDRFHNFDTLVVKKLFTWAMMIRVDMQQLGFSTINRYAIGVSDNNSYSNALPVISIITNARRHTDISSMNINIKPTGDNWKELYQTLCELNGLK